MNRREFIISSVGLAAGTSLAGCTGSETRPPRRSAIVNDIMLQDGELVVDIKSDPTVTTRAERVEGSTTILPVGVASARKGGSGGKRGGTSSAIRSSARTRGSRSSYRSAHTSRTGFAYYYWSDDHDDWYEENEDVVQQVEPEINRIAVAAVPDLEEKELGPGTVAWDELTEGSKGEEVSIDISGDSDWYRVGIDLERFSADLGWEFYDVEVTEDGVGQMWKVPPTL